MTKEELAQLMDVQIDEAGQLLGLTAGGSALVLQFFQWNMDKLQAQFFDNREECVAKAGVALVPAKWTPPKPVRPLGPPPPPPLTPQTEMVECLICLNDVPFKSTFALGCGHRYYCLDCWRAYLQDQFKTKAATMATQTRCMAPRCPVRTLLPPPPHALDARRT